MKRAQLVADAVAVLCPLCGEPQPNRTDGSEQWTMTDFTKLPSSRFTCVSCDAKFIVTSDTKVMFQ